METRTETHCEARQVARRVCSYLHDQARRRADGDENGGIHVDVRHFTDRGDRAAAIALFYADEGHGCFDVRDVLGFVPSADEMAEGEATASLIRAMLDEGSALERDERSRQHPTYKLMNRWAAEENVRSAQMAVEIMARRRRNERGFARAVRVRRQSHRVSRAPRQRSRSSRRLRSVARSRTRATRAGPADDEPPAGPGPRALDAKQLIVRRRR